MYYLKGRHTLPIEIAVLIDEDEPRTWAGQMFWIQYEFPELCHLLTVNASEGNELAVGEEMIVWLDLHDGSRRHLIGTIRNINVIPIYNRPDLRDGPS